MRSLLNAAGNKIFKFHDFAEEEPEADEVEDVQYLLFEEAGGDREGPAESNEFPYLMFSEEDLILRKPETPVKEEKSGETKETEAPEEAYVDPVARKAEKIIGDAERVAENLIN